MIFGKHLIELEEARRAARWYQDEYAFLKASADKKDQKIRDLQGSNADIACKLERYEACATEAVKKKVAALEAKNEAELKKIGEQAIKDGKYQA